MADKQTGDLGRVVVIGGNGFLGHHIVNQVLDSWTASSVASIDLRCDQHRNPRAAYRECDITDSERLQSVIEDLKPDVVIHTASPMAAEHRNSKELFRRVNIDGTKAVIAACQNASVKALVFTSSASLISDDSSDLINADERWPVIRGSQQPSYYTETKAAAEEAVLKANREEPSGMVTCSIRPAALFGEGDAQTTAGFMEVYRNGRNKVQVGDNLNIFDFTYVGNVAHAHLLAARLLLATAAAPTPPLDHEKVDGEAFFITNDSPIYFWDFARAFWAAAGDKTGTKGVWSLPKDLGLLLGSLSEIFGYITRQNPTFNRKKITMSCSTRYFNISKARSVLRYEPRWSLQEGITRSVNYFLEQEKKATEKAQ